MKILQKEITGTQTSISTKFWWETEFHPVFPFPFLSACTAARDIFTALTCTATIITLEPCALNAEFQHFIPRFNKNFLSLQIPLKREDRAWGDEIGGWNRGWLLWITLLLKTLSIFMYIYIYICYNCIHTCVCVCVCVCVCEREREILGMAQ